MINKLQPLYKEMPPVKNIKEVTEQLKEEILKGDIHTIEEMKVWLQPLGNSNIDRINAIRKEVLYKEMER